MHPTEGSANGQGWKPGHSRKDLKCWAQERTLGFRTLRPAPEGEIMTCLSLGASKGPGHRLWLIFKEAKAP